MRTKGELWFGIVALATTLIACTEGPRVSADAGADSVINTDMTAREDGGSSDVTPADTYRPPAHWETVANMNQARLYHTATVLQDGRVLVVGGYSYDGAVGLTAELYDPADGSWTPTGEMTQGHHSHIAALLPDGRVLVAGGCPDAWFNQCSVDVGVDIFDPSAPAGQRWQAGTSMSRDRVLHCSATLNDGRVLVAGGWANTENHRSIEIYDNQTGQWTMIAATMSTPRNGCTATTLASGKVLIAGGYDPDLDAMVDTLEVFDPGTGTITLISDKLPEGRMRHDAALLGDGRVMIAGGERPAPGEQIGTDAIYDPSTDRISTLSSPLKAHGKRVTALADGRILSTGGAETSNKASIFDPLAGSWSTAPNMPATFEMHRAVLLNDGSVLLTGGGLDGASNTGSNSAAIFVP